MKKGFVLDRPQWNVRVPGGSLRRLPDGGGASFSPDGKSVAFQTAEGELWAARSDGSGAQKLVSGQSFPSLVESSADGSTFDTSLVALHGRPTEAGYGLGGTTGSGRYLRAAPIFTR